MLRFRKTKADAVSGFLGAQTEFTGKLAFSGVVHLDGSFQGEIISRGTLIVGRESVVRAQIYSNVLKIAGEVRGDLTATEKIELYPPAKVYGTIKTPSLIIEEGVIFEGTCSMSSVPAELPGLVETREPLPEGRESFEMISAEPWAPAYEEQAELEPEQGEDHPLHKTDT
jgi:cytoskeletal protein CcmA (bactofilin family)